MRNLVLACIVLILWPSQSQAKREGKSSSEDAESKTAKIACAAGDFRKGVEILAKLYVDTDDTTFVYNQGRCYEQNHQWVSAIDRFREYLRKTPNIAPRDAADTEKHIADCRAFQAEEEKQIPLSAPAVSQPPMSSAQPPPSVASSPTVPSHTTPQESGKSVLPTIGIVVGSVGLSGVAAGVVLNVKANQAADSGLDSSQKSYETAALLCYAVGGVALVSGVVLYLVGTRARTSSGNLALTPVWRPGLAGLALEGEF
jgi:hypothetical protein